MEEKRAETIIPPYWRGVTKSRSFEENNLILGSFDTETFFGRVFASGFHDGKKLQILHGLDRDHLGWLLDNFFLLTRAHEGRVIISAHYLIFDLGVLLWKILNPLETKTQTRAPTYSHFSILKSKTEIKIVWGRPCFAVIKRGDRVVTLVDTFSFFVMGLGKALDMIGSKTKKLSKPHHLGKRIIPLPEVSPYLTNDTKGVYDLLEELKRLHIHYGIKFTLSLPMLSGQIFRAHYIKKNFAKPSGSLRHAAMLSYHGGKNSFPGKAGWYPGATDLDLNSAYPEAMRQLPDFGDGKWIWCRNQKLLLKEKHSILRVTGTIKPCSWGSLFNHDFSRAKGRVVGLWITSYELHEVLLAGEFTLESVSGYYFKEKNPDSPSPFTKFVDDFYKLKEGAKNETARYFYKLILNSLYGKFIARIRNEDNNFVAGSMFSPEIASLITGFVRAKIHRLEHKYKAIHTATDGFLTQQIPDPADIGPEMGKLKKVNFGPCLILRNKLYLHYDEAGLLKKSGLHGFEGTSEELQKLWDSAKRTYTVEKMSKWGQAWHTGKRPGVKSPVKRVLGVSTQRWSTLASDPRKNRGQSGAGIPELHPSLPR